MRVQGYTVDSTCRHILRFEWAVRTDGGGVGSEAQKEKTSRAAYTQEQPPCSSSGATAGMLLPISNCLRERAARVVPCRVAARALTEKVTCDVASRLAGRAGTATATFDRGRAAAGDISDCRRCQRLLSRCTSPLPRLPSLLLFSCAFL
jgi:hypothetical protein